MLHECVMQLFFGLFVALAVATSRWWREDAAGEWEWLGAKGLGAKGLAAPFSRKLTCLNFFTCSLVILQVVLGAWLRHIAWYDTAAMFRLIFWMHLFTAIAIASQALLLWSVAGRGADKRSALKRPTQGLLLLVCIQIGLGCGTWVLNYSWPGIMGRFHFAARYVTLDGSMGQTLITTAHVAVGSLILALSLQTAMRWFRIRRCRPLS